MPLEAQRPAALDCPWGRRATCSAPRRIDNGTHFDARLYGATAPAETFHNRDDILFEGTIRLAVSNAAVCNLLRVR